MRSPGLDTRLIPSIVRTRSSEYLSMISRVVPGRDGSSRTVKPEMKPSRSRMPARDSFSLEPGIFTESNWALFALRMRVSMSAMGSVIVMGAPPSPARLGHAGDLPRVDHRAQADPAQPELAVDGLGPSAPLAPCVRADLELRGPLLLVSKGFLRHGTSASPVGTGSRRP